MTRHRATSRTALSAMGAAALMATAAGCGSDATTTQPGAGAPAGSTASGTTSAASGTLTVFAAASLKKTFTQLGQDFEASHPGTTVTFSFAGSSDLVTQLQQGAPADVFASADTKNMDKATGDSLVEGSPVDFATNTLEIAVPPGNPAKVTDLKSLVNPAVKVVLCAPEVPCGAASQKVETAAGIDIKPVSEESSVTDVLGKVSSGEADAGLVYVTDVKAAGDTVEGVTFDESSAAVNRYPIATLADSRNVSLAKEFFALVTGSQGQQVLADAGFAKP
jgi:molybdate transport system substrate-binding protein